MDLNNSESPNSELLPPAEPSANPWITIWRHPRQTMRAILDSNPERQVILLTVLGGISQSLDKAMLKNMGDKFPFPLVLALCLIVGSLGGLLSLYLSGFILKWTGGWIGGKGSAREIRAALAWSNIPSICVLAIVIPEIFVFGKELFQSNTPLLDSSVILISVFTILSIAEFIIGIWSCYITLVCISEAQQFSVWKALLNLAIPCLLVLIPILLLLIPLTLL